MSDSLQVLREFTVRFDYGRSHTTVEVCAAGQRAPVIRMHKDYAHHAEIGYEVCAVDRPQEVLGYVGPSSAFGADRQRVGTVSRYGRRFGPVSWSVLQHDLGGLTGRAAGANSRVRQAPVAREFLNLRSLDALLSVSLRFSGPQSDGFDFTRRAGVLAAYEVKIHDPRVNRLLVLALVGYFNEFGSIDPRKTAVSLTTNPFQGYGRIRAAQKRRQARQDGQQP